MIYAHKGEHVTCENGHRICTMARDVEVGQLFDANRDLTDWVQPEPSMGTLAKDVRCVSCGAFWFGGPTGEGAPLILHFEDGWRDVFNKEPNP